MILGILGSLVGVGLLLNLGLAFTTVVFLTGIFFALTGFGGAIVSVINRKFVNLWGLHLVLGILVGIAGITLLCNFGFAIWLTYALCAAGFFINGITLIVLSFQVKKYASGSWVVMFIFGILTLLCAFIILANPLVGIFVVAISAAISVLIYGINCIVVSLQMKDLDKRID